METNPVLFVVNDWILAVYILGKLLMNTLINWDATVVSTLDIFGIIRTLDTLMLLFESEYYRVKCFFSASEE